MSWMILPCLFVYLFIGVVLVAWLDEQHDCDTDGVSVLFAMLWPVVLLAMAIDLLRLLIKKVRSYL